MTTIRTALACAVICLAAPIAQAQTQGVTDTEIVIGSHNDLSGIFAAFGAPAVKAASQYFQEINNKGGVHGRRIRFVVEDHGYQMPRATQAINKLINSDRVFAMLLSLGTPMNLAAFKIMDERKIPNVSPLTAARQMLQDPIDYKFVGFSSYYDQIKAGVKYLVEKHGAKTICSMYIPTDFGLEIQQGAVDQSKAMNLKYATETTHKPDEADFVGALTRHREAGCDVITLALGVRQTITVSGTVKKMGWNEVKLISSSAGFHTAIAQVPGGVTEGLYASAGWSDLINRMDKPEVKAWVEAYRAANNEMPGTGALLGRSAAGTIVRAFENAGRNLTPETFRQGMYKVNYYDPLTDTKIDYGPKDHQGADVNIISIVKGGNWSEVARY